MLMAYQKAFLCAAQPYIIIMLYYYGGKETYGTWKHSQTGW